MLWSQKYKILLQTLEKWKYKVAENGNNQVKSPRSEIKE